MAAAAHFHRNYFDDNSVPSAATAHERDFLHSTQQPYMTAFRPRPQRSHPARKASRSSCDMDIGHRMRTSVSESVKPRPSPPFHLWVELGCREPPFPPRWDEGYNSNVWRNFSHSEGYKIDSPWQTTGETVAVRYPFRIPPPSGMTCNTLSKYISESEKVIMNKKKKDVALAKSKRELKEFKLLKLRGQMRAPPMDKDGNVLPPENMKHYDHPEIRLPDTTTESYRLKEEHERDTERHVLGTHRTNPARLWKLSFRDDSPGVVKASKPAEGSSSSRSFRPTEVFFK